MMNKGTVGTTGIAWSSLLHEEQQPKNPPPLQVVGVFNCEVQNTIYGKIREGQIVVDLYRPIRLLGNYLADDLGTMISSVVNKALPLFLLAALLFETPLPSSSVSFLLFLPSSVFSYSIL